MEVCIILSKEHKHVAVSFKKISYSMTIKLKVESIKNKFLFESESSNDSQIS